MKSLIHSALLLAVFLTGCTISKTTTRQDDRFAAELTRVGMRQTGKVTARDGSTYRARAIRIEGDSLTFLRVASRRTPAEAVPEVVHLGLNDLFDVEFVDHGNGALEGLGLGTLGGFVVGFAIGATSAHEPCEGWFDMTCGSPSEVGGAWGLVVSLPSGFFGLIGGALRGKHRRFEFTEHGPRRYR